MADYANGRPVSPATRAGLEQFAIAGASVLRQHVAHSNYTERLSHAHDYAGFTLSSFD